MKHKLQKIKEESQGLCTEISSDLHTSKAHLGQIGDEYHRVTELSHAPMVIIDDIDRKFEKTVNLHGSDMAFLFLAAGLQCFRQYFITMVPAERPGHDAEAERVKGHSTTKSVPRIHRYYEPSLIEIQTNTVPFDLHAGGKASGILSGWQDHRYATPGHDPVLGYLFGTCNVATSTLTNWRWESVHVRFGLIGKAAPQSILKEKAKTSLVLSYSKDKLLNRGAEGRLIIWESLRKEYQHLRSDVRSKDSLPLPGLSAIDPSLGEELAKRGLDMAMVLDVGKQLSWSIFFDAIIAMIHSFLYDEAEGISRSVYEVRTRKILVYSNLMASASNMIAAAVAQSFGMDGMRIVDWGGYLNTLRHIAFDTKFIHEVKKDFLKNQLYDRIVGTEYDFMKGDF